MQAITTFVSFPLVASTVLKHRRQVILSAPAENQSGTGSNSAPPTPRDEPCQFNSCPAGSPAEGSDPHDGSFACATPVDYLLSSNCPSSTQLRQFIPVRCSFCSYAQQFTCICVLRVDSVRYAINTLAPSFWNGMKPEFVISGPNVGSTYQNHPPPPSVPLMCTSDNLGAVIQHSGTVYDPTRYYCPSFAYTFPNSGAACEASLSGIPSAAFSGASGAQVSYTTLETDPNSSASRAARLYAKLTEKVLRRFLAQTGPEFPVGVSLNINYPATTDCPSVSDFHFVLTRLLEDSSATDVETCGTNHLPDERSVVVGGGCFASISAFNASSKVDVSASVQKVALERLRGILTCWPDADLDTRNAHGQDLDNRMNAF